MYGEKFSDAKGQLHERWVVTNYKTISSDEFVASWICNTKEEALEKKLEMEEYERKKRESEGKAFREFSS